MLASLFNKGVSSSPIEMPSLYTTSPLSLTNTDSEGIVGQKVSNMPLYGTADIAHFKFDRSEFRILVLEDTGNLLSTDRYYVLYDSDLERSKQAKGPRGAEHLCDPREVKQIAQYLFGSSFQGECKQFSRIHCEPRDLPRRLKNKTLVVRTYHFDANFEDTLLGVKAGPSNAAAKDVSNAVSDTVSDASPRDWTAEPATKIDHDFSSKNNTPIGICIMLPFRYVEWTQTVGANCHEFDKWLYEIQDLALKYLKKYYALQVEPSRSASLSSMVLFLGSPKNKDGDGYFDLLAKNRHAAKTKFKFFKVDNVQRNKIHFSKFLLQHNFESENVFLNYYHRINIFLNTPRMVTGITSVEKLLKLSMAPPKPAPASKKNVLFLLFCKELRHWLTIQDSTAEPRFLPTLLSVLYPLRALLVDSKPANKKNQIVRVVFTALSDVVINSLMYIVSCFLPDVVFKYSILSELDFNKSKDSIAMKVKTAKCKPLISRCSILNISEPIPESGPSPAASKFSSANPRTSSETPRTASPPDSSLDSIETRSTTTRAKLPALDLSAIDIKQLGSDSRTNSSSRSNSRPQTPYMVQNVMPPSPILSKNRGGLQLSSPKSIPVAYASTYDSVSVYSSQSEASSYKSMSEMEPSFIRSSSISSNNNITSSVTSRGMINTSRSSSFAQNDDGKFEPRKRLVKTLSVADLTQKSIRASSSKNKLLAKVDFIKRTPTAILSMNTAKYSTLANSQASLKAFDTSNPHKRLVVLEDDKYRKNYIRDIINETSIKTSFDAGKNAVNVPYDSFFSFNDEYKESYLYTDSDSELECESKLSDKYFDSGQYGKVITPCSEINLPPLVGVSPEFIPEFTIQTIKKNDHLKQLIINAMKQDLFHNEYIDRCCNTPYLINDGIDTDDRRSISKTVFVNLSTREINEFEIILKLDKHRKKGFLKEDHELNSKSLINIPKPNISSSMNSHARHSSIFSLSSVSSSSAGSSSHQSLSSSPIKTSPSIMGLFDFNNNYLTNNNPFTFQGRDFVLLGNKILDDHGKLYAKDMLPAIAEMEELLNTFACIHDDVDA